MPDGHTRFARFLHNVGRLKTLPRTGWRDRGVPALATESVADHSYRLAMLAWLAALDQPGLDASRVLQLAMIHDLAEALCGDPTPYAAGDLPDAGPARRAFLETWHRRDPAASAAKVEREDATMITLLADVPAASAAVLAALWAEYRAQSTAESRFVKQADRLETFLQSREYLAVDPSLPMASFAAEAAAAITDPLLIGLREAILAGEWGEQPPAPSSSS